MRPGASCTPVGEEGSSRHPAPAGRGDVRNDARPLLTPPHPSASRLIGVRRGREDAGRAYCSAWRARDPLETSSRVARAAGMEARTWLRLGCEFLPLYAAICNHPAANRAAFQDSFPSGSTWERDAGSTRRRRESA